MPTVSIRHLTRYRYRRAVAFGEHRMMLRPREDGQQRILAGSLVVTPGAARGRCSRDVFGNAIDWVRFSQRADTLSFESRMRLDHAPAPSPLDAAEGLLGSSRFVYAPRDRARAAGAIEPGFADPAGDLQSWARRFLRPRRSTRLADLVAEMASAIGCDFAYRRRLEGPARAPLETLALRQGSCRDFAVLMIEALRSLGLAAQFVSGYVYDSERAQAAGPFSGGGHTHAWACVLLPGAGWVDVDPTWGAVGAAGHVRVARVREPGEASPVQGSFIGAAADFLGLEVEVEVLNEDRRVVLAPRLERAAA